MKRFVILFVVAALFLTFAPIVEAGTQGKCVVGDVSKIHFYENAIGDTSDGDDSLWQCGQFDTMWVSHTLPGECHSQYGHFGNWFECVSSWQYWIPAHYRLCVYHGHWWDDGLLFNDVNYGDQNYASSRWNFTPNDWIGSWAYYTEGSSC